MNCACTSECDREIIYRQAIILTSRSVHELWTQQVTLSLQKPIVVEERNDLLSHSFCSRTLAIVLLYYYLRQPVRARNKRVRGQYQSHIE